MKMKIKTLIVLLAAGVFINGCKSEESKMKDIANDMCGCFNKLKDSFPPAAIAVFEKAAVSANPRETFTTEMQKLGVADALKVNAALTASSKPGSAMSECLNEIDKKYKTTETDQQKMAGKVIEALKDKKGCEIMMALLRMNQEVKK